MDIVIPDDPSHTKAIFDELKENFYLNTTHKAQFRQKSLAKLIDGYKEMQSEFDEALKHDCGYNPFMSNFAAHNVTMT